MHIVQLLPELRQGGVETVVLCLNRELVREGHQSTVISAGGQWAVQIEADGGRHIEFDVCSKNPLTFFSRARKLEAVFSSLCPDLLHAHSRVPAWLTWFANRKLHIPWVTTVHGFNSVGRYSEIMTKGDRVICVSHPVKEHIISHYGTDESKIKVIHTGLIPQKFDPLTVDKRAVESLKARFDLTGKTVISSIGRITELKDYETFILAVAGAAEKNPDIRGLIVGHVRKDKEEYFNRLTRLISALKLENVVHIATDLTDMPAVYSASDIVVSCSKKPESFGLTLIEALAMNTPVIATHHGGPLDIIREGIDGFFFEPGHADELARLLNTTLALNTTGLRKDVLSRFSEKQMIEDTINTYRAVR
jgi:glycosyltransferase involved in cell wall biosynthesis